MSERIIQLFIPILIEPEFPGELIAGVGVEVVIDDLTKTRYDMSR